MIPANLSLQNESKAEEKVFHALQNSLDDFHTILSLISCASNLGNKLIYAEIDFLTFQEKRVLLTLKVKSGIISYGG